LFPSLFSVAGIPDSSDSYLLEKVPAATVSLFRAVQEELNGEVPCGYAVVAVLGGDVAIWFYRWEFGDGGM
jgi:hypothetical protein